MNPCYSGFQVQGAATAPTGMTPSDSRNFAAAPTTLYIITDKSKKCNTFLKIYKTNETLDHKSAGNVDDLSRYEGRTLTEQEHYRTSNVYRFTDSGKRRFVDDRGLVLIRK